MTLLKETSRAEAKGDQPSLRDAHKDLTRERILDAAIDALNDEELDQITIEGVAARAGLTKRTIYRHFATREDLLKATWPQMQKRVGSRGFPTTGREAVQKPLELFPSFDSMAGAVRASAFSRAGRELRLAVNDVRQKAMLSAVKDVRPDLSGPALIRLAAVIQLLNSAAAWAVMKDFWNLDGTESGRASSEAIAVLLGLELKEPGSSSPDAKPKKKRKTTP
ncbi:MAG TPA: TetR/AcrR family transcriptional regulator [Hyphomonadaceae bacterium]|nr:TetR/AcrR family transcriptional regulator [Hyphomonadaceae bacterium]